MEPNGALYTAAAAVLVAFITTAGTVLTALSAQRRAKTPVPEPVPAAGSTAVAPHGPTFWEHELAYAQKELREERQENDGLRQLLRIAMAYIRVLMAHIRASGDAPPEPPAGLDIDIP